MKKKFTKEEILQNYKICIPNAIGEYLRDWGFNIDADSNPIKDGNFYIVYQDKRNSSNYLIFKIPQ